MSEDSLTHIKWNCKYLIVIAPKYRLQIVYGKLRVEIGRILRDLCMRKDVEIIEESVDCFSSRR
jgi:putative transposase